MINSSYTFSRIALAIILTLCIFSCKINTTNPNDIVNSKDIKITISHRGCLGGTKQIISIKETNGIRVLTNNYIEGGYEPQRNIKFDSKKEQILKDLIKAGFERSDSSYCIGLAIYRIETGRYKCEFDDKTCKLDKYLYKLLEK
jgi:hypothetical protein